MTAVEFLESRIKVLIPDDIGSQCMFNANVQKAKDKEKIERADVKWKYFLDNDNPLNDWEILVYSNKKNKYYLEYTDSEFFQRAINRNYIKWMFLKANTI